MKLTVSELLELMSNKLQKAGLNKEHADIVADVLVFADVRGVHSHGAMRVEYYSERIAKGGWNTNPKFEYKETGPCSAIFDGDNASGHVVAKLAMDKAIEMAQKSGVAIVGVRRIAHSGSLGYFINQAVDAKMVAITLCQSDPMAVPYGGAESYYGTNPIAFGAPSDDGRALIMDLATTVQAWGKILHARSKNVEIPDTWAVDKDGVPTTDPFKVSSLVPIADAKGYALMMMVDVLSGVLLGLPFGNKVSSMYKDLSKGRELGQMHIVLNPSYFTDAAQFMKNITQTMVDLNGIKPAPGFDGVMYPGQRSSGVKAKNEKNGIEIVDDVYNYLISDVIHNNSYDNKDPFAK